MPPSAPSSAPRRPTALPSSTPSGSCCQPNQSWSPWLGRGEQLPYSSFSLTDLRLLIGSVGVLCLIYAAFPTIIALPVDVGHAVGRRGAASVIGTGLLYIISLA